MRLPHLFILLTVAPAFADYQTGLDAYEAGDYAKAMAEWKEEVNRPRVPTNLAVYREALYAIGMLYWQGEGVEQDFTVSAVWLKQAADINHPGAQNKLGYLYSTGQGVPQNYQQARHWFEMAAAQGDPDAVHNLDLMFQRGMFAETEDAAQTAKPDQQSESAPAPEPDPEVVSSPRLAMQPEPGTEPAPFPRAGVQPEPHPEAAPAPRTEAQPKVDPEAAPAPRTETQPEASPEAAPNPRAGMRPEPGPQTETRVQATQANTPPQPGRPESGRDPDAAWILAQNPEHYTIQVIALRSMDNLNAFVAENPRWEPFAIYTPARNERPLSVLIQGVYPDLASARAAVARFPPGLQAREALWVRKFGMVQDMLQ